MARTRIILGYPSASSTSQPHVVYAGLSGAAADSAMRSSPHSLRFEIFEGPGRRKNNPAFSAAAKVPAPAKLDIPADLKGLNKAELAASALAAIARIKELEDIIAALRAEPAAAPAAPVVDEIQAPTPDQSGDPAAS